MGDLIPYSITVNIPEGMGYQFPDDTYRHPTMTITDAPDVGLQFNNDLVVTVGTTEITINSAWINTSGNGFVLTLPASALAVYKGQDLKLTYSMYLDENANPDVGYDNVATVSTNELTDNDFTPDVYTGGKRFKKVDGNFDSNNTLEGAVFVVMNDAGKYLQVDNTTKAISWLDALTGANPVPTTATKFTSDVDGLVEVKGLKYGAYNLVEITPPTDYVKLESPISFTIAKGSYKDTEGLLAKPQNVVNVHKGRLPSTGGSGILGIVGIGAALVATTGGYYIKRKKDE